MNQALFDQLEHNQRYPVSHSRYHPLSNPAASFRRQDELLDFRNRSCRQMQWRPTRLKASAAGTIQRDTASRKPASSNESLSTKRDRQSDLVHPLFSKEKQKEKSGTGAKPSKAVSGSLPAKRSSKPAPKSEQRSLKSSQKPATVNTSADSDAKQPSEIQNKKPTKSAAEVPVALDTQQPTSIQSRKGMKEKGSKIQAAFAPQPTKLRMAPVSPDAIADPYQWDPSLLTPLPYKA